MSSQSANKNALGSGPRAASRMDLSGHERDKLFLSLGGRDVVDVSYLSGADGVEDARAFAHADLDHDGFEDLIVVNRNAPLLEVYKNQLGPASGNHFVGIRVEGVRQRDAVGAKLVAKGCGMTQTRELAIGAGFATVNSMTTTLGLGSCTRLDELQIQFPRGERRTFKNVAADNAYRIVEGKGIQQIANVYKRAPVTAAAPAEGSPRLAKLAASVPGHAPLVVIDLFATWCEACVRTGPRVDALAAITKLDLIAVTIEPTDDGSALDRYQRSHPSSHKILPYDAALVGELSALFGGSPALPSTVVVDRKTGAVVVQVRGVPTRSELERAIALH